MYNNVHSSTNAVGAHTAYDYNSKTVWMNGRINMQCITRAQYRIMTMWCAQKTL